MRTIIEIPNPTVERLDELCQQQKCSRAAIIRKAIEEFLAKQTERSESEIYNQIFGIRRKNPVDGVEYQNKLRKEWS